MKYIVTKEIKSETQVIWIFYLQDFMFLAIWSFLCLMMKERVHSFLEIPYIIFSALVGTGLMLPARGNPKRRMYQGIALYLLRAKNMIGYYREEEKVEENEDGTHQKRHSGRRI